MVSLSVWLGAWMDTARVALRSSLASLTIALGTPGDGCTTGSTGWWWGMYCEGRLGPNAMWGPGAANASPSDLGYKGRLSTLR